MPESEPKGRRLLSIDGGGVRGLSALIIIREIMYRIQVQEGLDTLPLPCDYFDLIGGTDTGGLIALMLGRLRMSVDSAIEAFHGFVKAVYADGRRHFGDEAFKTTALTGTVKAMVKSSLGDEDARVFNTWYHALTGSRACNAFVCTMLGDDLRAGTPVLLGTYSVRSNASPNCTVWEAVHATMAMPGHFQPALITVHGQPQPHISGSIGANDPGRQMLLEARALFPNDTLAALISVGTGHSGTITAGPMTSRGSYASRNVAAMAWDAVTDPEMVSEALSAQFSGCPGVYFRCTVGQGMQNVSLSDAGAMGDVVAQTLRHLGLFAVTTEVDSMVESLLQPHAGVLIAGVWKRVGAGNTSVGKLTG